MAQEQLDISVVIPLLNEEESLPELHAWISRVMEANSFSYEILFIDDGSTDTSWQVIEGLAAKDSNVKAIRFTRNYGKSPALDTGFRQVIGDVVITMDADLQDNPDEIPELYRMVTEDGYDLVSGWKKKRYDPLSKTIPTKLYNGVTRRMSGIKLHDFNCGLKAYRNVVVKNITVYGDMHRYIPVMAKWAGFSNIGEKVVQHQARKYGVTKFGGISRFINGPIDLLSIMFVGKYRKKPMHLFGRLGLLSFIVGFFITAYLIGYKFLAIRNDWEYRDIVDQPLFFLALVAVIVGSQMFLAGFVAELVSLGNRRPDEYKVRETLGGI